jgi:hypothetical protein
MSLVMLRWCTKNQYSIGWNSYKKLTANSIYNYCSPAGPSRHLLPNPTKKDVKTQNTTIRKSTTRRSQVSVLNKCVCSDTRSIGSTQWHIQTERSSILPACLLPIPVKETSLHLPLTQVIPDDSTVLQWHYRQVFFRGRSS